MIIVGGDDVSYGSKPPEGTTWKQLFLNEVCDQLDLKRVHFVGKLPYPDFIQLLQLSTVHVYLTYPFVLSWSLLEAMSAGCAIVASDTAPVREVIKHNETGLLVDFFDVNAIADQVSYLLNNSTERYIAWVKWLESLFCSSMILKKCVFLGRLRGFLLEKLPILKYKCPVFLRRSV